MKECIYCGSEVHPERFTLGYEYCVRCADDVTVPKVARMVYGHKTAGEIMVFDGTPENVRQADRANERRR